MTCLAMMTVIVIRVFTAKDNATRAAVDGEKTSPFLAAHASTDTVMTRHFATSGTHACTRMFLSI